MGCGNDKCQDGKIFFEPLDVNETGNDCWNVCKRCFIDFQVENKRLRERYKNYERLWDIVDTGECDGNCDSLPPYEKCPQCSARSLINELGEITYNGLQVIEQALKGEK